MMRFLHSLILSFACFLSCSGPVAAADAVIFNGSFAKALRPNFKLLNAASILTGEDDPTAVAKDAPKGSLYLRQTAAGDGSAFVKLDDGSSTNWGPIPANLSLQGAYEGGQAISGVSNAVDISVSGNTALNVTSALAGAHSAIFTNSDATGEGIRSNVTGGFAGYFLSNSGTKATGLFYNQNASGLVFQLYEPAGGQAAKIAVPNLTADYTLTLPTNDGDADQYLKTDGSGVLSWATVAAGGTLQDAYDAGTPHIITTAGSVYIEANDTTEGLYLYTNHGSSALTIEGDTGAAAPALKILNRDNGEAAIYVDAQPVGGSSSVGIDVGSDDALAISAYNNSTTAATISLYNDGSNTAPVIRMYESGAGNQRVDIIPAQMTANWALTLPADDGASNQYLTTDGSGVTSWAGGVPTSEVMVHTGNGHGSTNTKIRRFTTQAVSTGSAITYADSATLGATFTINEDGVYAATFMDRLFSTNCEVGISKNSNQLTTNIFDITITHRMAAQMAFQAHLASPHATFRAASGDVIRAHTSGNCDAAGYAQFWITQVARF